MRRPFVAGICGGIGSGKSAATRVFERLGAEVIDADRIAHDVLDEPPVKTAIQARFGAGVIEGGLVNRNALAALVFGDSPAKIRARRDLEAIVHPRIRFRIEAALTGFQIATTQPAVVVLDVPLLVESGLKDRCDAIVYIDAPEERRMARTLATRNWSADEHRAREAAQASAETRRAAATAVIDNRSSLADLEHACAALYRSWTAGP
jgi:dephospho-CoA kinase